MNGLVRSYAQRKNLGHDPKVLVGDRLGKRKIFHTAVPIFLKCLPETAAASVFRGRANFKPTRWYSSRCPTHTAFACMIREEAFNPSVGPMGALGISSETKADLGKERRTATSAPPAEMLMAVANSKQSLPLPSRVRMKIGIASCNRAHLRSSFLDKLRGTCKVHQSEVLAPLRPHLMGQTSNTAQECLTTNPNLATDRQISRVARSARDSIMTTGQANKVQRFSLRYRFRGCFQLTARCT